jgi:hypothetical protein
LDYNLKWSFPALHTWTEWTPSERSRRWKRRKKKTNPVARAWLRVGTVALVISVAGITAWAIYDLVAQHMSRRNSFASAAMEVLRGTDLSPWQLDVLNSLETAAQEVGTGNVVQAEVDVDRAQSALADAKRQSQRAESDFFQLAIAGLDRIWNQRPDDDGLFQHVAKVRIELATVRAAQNSSETLEPAPRADSIVASAPASAPSDVIPAFHGGANAAITTPPVVVNSAAKENSQSDASGEKKLSLLESRQVGENTKLNPASLGYSYLDATRMAESMEVLVPPARRLIRDNVLVEDLTITGASQTLDGIRWHNVTFVGTRLLYAKGPLDLENVHFVNCTFELPPDDQGARLADAIALGQTSFSSD